MDTKTAEAVLSIFNERRSIEQWIKDRYVRKDKSRLRRGPIKRALAKDLGLNLNPDFHVKVKNVFDSMGIRHITVDGVGYYGELALKETDNEIV